MAFPTVKKVAETLRIFAFRGEMLPPAELFDQPIDLNADAPPSSHDGWEQWIEINSVGIHYASKATGEMTKGYVKTLCFVPAAGRAARPTSYLVAAGCFACRRYLMVDKGSEECPLCKGEIITFEREAGGGAGSG